MKSLKKDVEDQIFMLKRDIEAGKVFNIICTNDTEMLSLFERILVNLKSNE